jgi:hypothetical protein
MVSLKAFIACSLSLVQPTQALFSVSRPKTRTTALVGMIQRDEYLQPHFEAPAPPPPRLHMDRVIECSQGGNGCSVEEMKAMMKGRSSS